MKTIEKYIGILVLAVLIVTNVVLINVSNRLDTVKSQDSSLGSLTGGENIYSSVASSSAMTLTTNSALITATSTTRQYAAIVNDCTTAIYLNFNDVAATGNSGLRLNASGGSYEINSQNLYKGAIRGISPSGNCVITYVEK